VDWETLYGPNPICPFYDVCFHKSRLVKNGTTRGQRQALCRSCRSSVALTYGTPYFELEHDPALFELAIRTIAKGNSIRATGRIIQVDKDTVCTWLDRTAQHCRLVMLYAWQQLPVKECQLDELWSFVHTKDEHLSWAKTYRDTYGDAWVWVAYAPEWRLVVAFVVGKRTQAEANVLLERVAHVTTDLIPFVPAINCRHTARPCCRCMENGTSRHGVEHGARTPIHGAPPPRVAICPSGEDARAGSCGGGRSPSRVWRRPTHGRTLGHVTDECNRHY
jgi:transposase-like protein